MDESTAALVGLAVILAKIVEKLIDFGYSKFKKEDQNDSELKIEELTTMIKSMHDLVTRVDLNGAPLVYFSRTIESRQIDATNLLNDITHSQINLAKILDKMADKLIDIGNKQEQIVYEMRKK